jgi:DNA-binding response OmpR family regulator
MRILLVEDQPELAAPTLAILRYGGYEAEWACSAEQATELAAEREPDLAILDVMLPEGEQAGFELARRFRRAGYLGSILFLTARDAVEDRVHGLDLGGDDYLVKPYSLEELLARVRALLRREAQTRQVEFQRGDLRVHFALRRALWQGTPIELSDKEFALLEVLSLYPERVFSAEELLDRLFPGTDSGTRIVRVYVHHLRRKIAPQVISTQPGGYCLGV